MKAFTVCYSFIKNNILPIVITVLMLTVAMFILSTFIGEYNYISYTRSVMLNEKLEGGAYFMPYHEGGVSYEETNELKNEIMQFEGCSHILSINKFAVEMNK